MFKPRKMKRTLIIGAKHDVEKTINLLHSLEIAHIIDYKPSDDAEPLQLGNPTETASGISQRLLSLRSSSQLLALDKKVPTVSEKIPETRLQEDIHQKVRDLENNVLSLVETKTRIEEHYRKINERIQQLQPFVSIDIPLEYYQGYDNVVVFTGYVRDMEKLKGSLLKITNQYELFTSNKQDQMIALFIEKTSAEDAGKLLSECGFTEIKLT